MIEIYCHTNRITGKSYVGQSCNGMEHRWKGHVKSAGKCDLLFANAIRKHGPDAFDHALLEQHESQEDADEAEDFFIQYLGTMAPNGYNLRGGGSHGRPSEEMRQKISAARKGRKLSEEHRRNMSAAQKGRKFSAEHRRNISEAHKGQKHSEESRRKISAAAKGRKLSEESRRKISSARKGQKHSEEHRRNLSAAQKGRKFSEEHRRKISAAAKLREAKKRQTS